ncbi:MAG: paraquat-inducible protein A [Pseudomonadota bacterium]
MDQLETPDGIRPAMVKTPRPTETDGAAAQTTSIWDVLSELLLYISAALIVTGLILPSICKPNMFGFGGAEYNLYGIVQTLFESGLPILGLIVVFFSAVFPLAKTVTAAIIFRQGASPSPKLASLLNILGKWSMLDVFLAALLIGISQISIYIGFETRAGLYYFAAGVIANNAATMRLTFTRLPK